MPPPAIDAGFAVPAPAPCPALPIPKYLEQVYWWAYVHPNAVRVFEREWLVNLILFGNYGRLRDAALAELGAPVTGQTLQLACVYGNLTPRLARRLAPGASLDVVDILPVQLKNLAAKLPADDRIVLLQGDSSSLACGDACYDQALLFFLLHEQPEAERAKTVHEALRVMKPGGTLVIVDYGKPRWWNPMRYLLPPFLMLLEPFALSLMRRPIADLLPPDMKIRRTRYFGGLYQKVVATRA